jgi:hypothetical protein
MQNKAQQRNVIPATAIAVAGTLTSATHTATYGRGVRFFVTVSGATAGGGLDTIFLCAVPPSGGPAVPIVGFSTANSLSVAGVYIADFYPGAWLPPTIAAGGNLLGIAGIYTPISWAVRIVMGAGNAATIAVDAETLP